MLFLASFSPFPDEPEWVIEIGIGPIGMIAWCSANGEISLNFWVGKFLVGFSAGCEGPEGDNHFSIDLSTNKCDYILGLDLHD
jgi:hypothetical protein